MKFTSYEVHGNAPLIDHSPITSWMNILFGVRGASDVIGTIEFATAAALILGAFVPAASAVGAAVNAGTRPPRRYTQRRPRAASSSLLH